MILQQEFLDKMTKNDQIKFIKGAIELLQGQIDHKQTLIKELQSERTEYEEMLHKLTFEGELCDKDYYAIRSGGCEHAETYNGRVHCRNPHCENYLPGF